ncbi:hypothetical protein XMIN_508 [Xanthomonas citri pv. mangiferaeindicae LMG 941]|nr:hypothetical protein XMIN_508 [Xanthomonas citri pv. mangiferaeindicae LMG 941]
MAASALPGTAEHPNWRPISRICKADAAKVGFGMRVAAPRVVCISQRLRTSVASLDAASDACTCACRFRQLA